MTVPLWRKGKRCQANNGCVEAARLSVDVVGVRDSTDPHGSPVLEFDRDAFAAFIFRVKAGQ